ncbi:dual serine/threonine and tyrosine protein kinase-like isoform X3 [Odontomachus brunneus]|uniref:dual serine/threonine and tyrosine protein kinase-like isoform X3 n=1 Tax=Odontomachus brunneus TaxID=486640 RepID=UPI0013F2A273|nr:dual serine/threonine and tyrosine protein kinase-like isoform X3 [Odontomachus brunneus]
MASKLPMEFKKYYRNKNQLQHVLEETQRALEAINLENFFPGENIIKELLPPLTLNKVTYILDNFPAIIVLGQDNKAKASLVNNLFSTDILPLSNGSWRWVKLTYGHTNHVSLTLSLEYEVIEKLQANEKPWNTLPVEDLTMSGSEDVNCPTILDVKLDQAILKDDVHIFIVPNSGAIKVLAKGSLRILPIFLYALGEQPLTEENMEELKELKETYPYYPVLFISSLTDISFDSFIDAELTESEQHSLQNQRLVSNDLSEPKSDNSISIDKMNSLGLTWLNQLTNLGFLGMEESVEVHKLTWLVGDQYVNSSHLVDSCNKMDDILSFTRNCLQNYLFSASSWLNEIHTISLRKFILSAFDMARKIQITPRRIQYAQQKENELYANLMKVVNEQQEALSGLIQFNIEDMKNEILISINDISQHQTTVGDNERVEWTTTVRVATSEVQQYVLGRLGKKVAKELVDSINCLRETFVGTLERCLISLEKTYEHDNNSLASDALKQILSTAYNIELHNSSPSLVHSFLERLRQLFKTLPLPWAPTPTLDVAWRRKVTIDVLNSLSAARLARTISMQFKEKLKSSHDIFQNAMESLENYYSGNLERTEEQRIAIRKYHAPKLAKLALESMSMMDTVRFGIPQCGKEIGRGQYGVVYSCDGWGGAPGPCAIKSVVPPDERHWNDLAMEVYYTRSIPDHKRIVKLRGSIIDLSYGGGFGSGAVLLITDRLSRDLYCGLRTGLSWLERIQVAIDVLEAIRYLHSQGLVHRDIKLKNVLLDTENRAKLTDLGFCITEAMMSGSIVGTPIHMAPELLSGHYDSSVDVYAFGILFWYICAGNVRLPYAFEQFHNKEQLWINVRKGIRPEKLSRFDEECWTLMEQCWSGEPSKRPLLGAIQPVLESIQQKAERGKSFQQSDALKLEDTESSSEQTNPALALAEPNNQRGAPTSPLFPRVYRDHTFFRTETA